MQAGATVVSVAVVILLGKVWSDLIEVWKYKMRANMCLNLVKDAIEMFERYEFREH